MSVPVIHQHELPIRQDFLGGEEEQLQRAHQGHCFGRDGSCSNLQAGEELRLLKWKIHPYAFLWPLKPENFVKKPKTTKPTHTKIIRYSVRKLQEHTCIQIEHWAGVYRLYQHWLVLKKTPKNHLSLKKYSSFHDCMSVIVRS